METKDIPSAAPVVLDQKQLEFEKYKLEIGLYRWLIGSVAIVLLAMQIEYQFRDREVALQEMQQYDKYITELVVLNEKPSTRRLLAQFFACVTPSCKLRAGWEGYYNMVDSEYQKTMNPVIARTNALTQKYNELKDLFLNQAGKISEDQKNQMQIIEDEINANERLITPKIILPSTSSRQLAIDWESKGFSYLLAKDVENAILAFQNSEDSYNTFHQVHEIAQYLRENRAKLKNTSSSFWEDAFKEIANKFSWKMPNDIKDRLLNEAK